MPAATRGIGARRIADTPIAVLDFETTGLTPGIDRVIEVAVVRIEPGREPQLVFDTLVNPRRPIAATEIHGITDADVADAPLFQDIVGDLVDALSSCVVTAYNVYFDMKFLEHELGQTGLRQVPPHLCLMYLRPMLGLGSRCRLADACNAHGIAHRSAHAAASDAQASSRLMEFYLRVLQERGVATFGELADLGTYKFLSSLTNDPFTNASKFRLRPSGRRRSRTLPAEAPRVATAATEIPGIREYWDALSIVVCDLQITDDELEYVKRIRDQFGLKKEHMRVLHARAFASVISQFVSDQWIDDRERSKLHRFHRCLSILGWAPGE